MADETTTTEQPETDNATAAGDGQGQAAPPVTFTQDQLDAIVKDRLERANAKITSDLMAELGIEDTATAKKTLAEAQAAKEAQMSELEKAQADIAEAQAQAAQATTEAEAIKVQADEALLKAAIISQAGNFHKPMQAWLLIDRSKIETQEDGTYKGIDEALKVLAETDPHLIKADGQPGPGTPTRAKPKSIAEKLIEGQKKDPPEKRRSTIRM
jgi:multidrug efflux pump subunit AcrA (membrane-fusion protein)